MLYVEIYRNPITYFYMCVPFEFATLFDISYTHAKVDRILFYAISFAIYKICSELTTTIHEGNVCLN